MQRVLYRFRIQFSSFKINKSPITCKILYYEYRGQTKINTSPRCVHTTKASWRIKDTFLLTAPAHVCSFSANPCGKQCSGSLGAWVVDLKWENPARAQPLDCKRETPSRDLNRQVCHDWTAVKGLKLQILTLYLTTQKWGWEGFWKP